jgi:hypothetical protein
MWFRFYKGIVCNIAGKEILSLKIPFQVQDRDLSLKISHPPANRQIFAFLLTTLAHWLEIEAVCGRKHHRRWGCM